MKTKPMKTKPMKKNKKRLTLIFLAFTTSFITPFAINTSYATEIVALAQNNTLDLDELNEAANGFYNALGLLMEGYKGSDITIEKLYDAALKGITDTLDTYTEYLTEEEFSAFMVDLTSVTYGVGITMEMGDDGYAFVTGLVDDMPAKKAGILVGDKVISVNDKPMLNQSFDTIRANIAGEEGSTVTITVLRNGEKTGYKVVRAPISNKTIYTVYGEELNVLTDNAKVPENCAYILLSSVSDNTTEEFGTAIAELQAAGIKNIILDLRNNTGGFLDQAIEICNMLVPKGPVMHMIDKKGKMLTYNSMLEKKPFEKIVVLTNNFTASAAEIIASALQDSDAGIVVGQTTYGKGVVQSTYKLNYGGILKMTTDEYFSRSMKPINNIGVVPDVIIEQLFIKPLEDGEHADVVTLKKVLKLLGYAEVGSDNAWNKETEKALESFQTSRGLTISERLTEETINAMNNWLYMYYTEMDITLLTGLNELINM